MPRKLRPTAKIDTLDRLKLPRRGKPYFTVVSPGVRLGYRRTENAGSWVVEKADGRGGVAFHERIGTADDYEAANGDSVLTFWQAADEARRLAHGTVTSAPSTWGRALDDYESDLKARGGSVYNARQVRNHLTALAPALLDKRVALLGATELTCWRNALKASKLKVASVVRILKSARASLNLAANHDPRIQNRSAWRVGLGGLSDGYEPINRVVPDTTVRKIMVEADALDAAFGLFVAVAAETGARASQIAKLEVADLHTDTLSMPSSRKGKRNRAITRTPVPISAELAAKLRHAADGRALDAPLLLRDDGKPFDPTDKRHLQEPFGTVAKALQLGETMYCLRHSSIVRSLLANVPVRLTASLHDTSVAQLERTYSRFIADHGGDTARRGLLAAGNVVSLEERRA
jgi:integrase